jgi:hypothetical protein
LQLHKNYDTYRAVRFCQTSCRTFQAFWALPELLKYLVQFAPTHMIIWENALAWNPLLRACQTFCRVFQVFDRSTILSQM